MTAAPTTNAHPYRRALRYYTRAWQERHGADMVAMMMDAADNGEDPLSEAGRRSLMWSGLRQRFASRPLLLLSITVGMLALVAYELSATRLYQIGIYVDNGGTYAVEGFDRWLWPSAIGAACLFLLSTLIVTVSVLHLPPFPRRTIRPTPWGWSAWIAFALSPVLGLAPFVSVAVLIAAAWLYRRTQLPHYRVLAGLSATWIATSALLFMPGMTFVLMCQAALVDAAQC